jgi:hypothetical protein
MIIRQAIPTNALSTQSIPESSHALLTIVLLPVLSKYFIQTNTLVLYAYQATRGIQ